MNNGKDSTRLKRMKDGLADSAVSSIIEAGNEIIPVFINDAKSWLMDAYEKLKNGQALESKYKELQRYIEESNESVQIGMDKKEIAVMWAMRKLGYTQEKTQEVLDLANKAYLPKEER